MHQRSLYGAIAANMLGMLGLSVYILADTFFVASGVGADGLAALNLALPAYSLIHASGLLLGMGGATRYATALGRGDRAAGRSVFAQMLLAAGGVAALLALIGLTAAEPTARLLGASGGLLGMTRDYLRVDLLFAPVFILSNLLTALVRADGGARWSMAAMLTASLTNIVLDYLFIFPLGLGLFGAALATGIGSSVSLLVLLGYLLRRRDLRPGRMPPLRQLGRNLSPGLSALLTELTGGLVMLAINQALLRVSGALAVAVYGVVANVSLVLVSLMTGLGQGAQPLISRTVGAGGDAGGLARRCLALALGLGAVFTLGVELFAPAVVAAFNRAGDPAFAQMGTWCTRLYFTGLIPMGLAVVASCALSAMGRPVPALAVSLLRGCLLPLPLVALLPVWLGLAGVYASAPLSELGAAAAALALLKPRKQNRPAG
ncbi:MAG: MATE family efflux transporter [Christensenellales bacterium]